MASRFPNISYINAHGEEFVEMDNEAIQNAIPEHMWPYFATKLKDQTLSDADKMKLSKYLSSFWYAHTAYQPMWLTIFRFHVEGEPHAFTEFLRRFECLAVIMTYTSQWGPYTLSVDEMFLQDEDAQRRGQAFMQEFFRDTK